MLLYKNESYNIIGAAMEVHRVLGVGFTEYVYQDAFEVECKNRGIPYVREKHLTISYKGSLLRHDYFVDFLCYDSIIVECKAVENLHPVHEAQVINYLKATNLSLGLLINFGEQSLRYKRLINQTN